MSQSSGPVAKIEPLTAAGSLDRLVRQVGNSVPVPVNVLQVAALLETAGVTDTIAARDYGYDSIFALAHVVFSALLDAFPESAVDGLPLTTTFAQTPEVQSDDRKAKMVDYLRGPFSVLPLVLLSLMINFYQLYGQWSSERVLILSGATIGSLLVTSGFVQVAARKGSIYLSQGFVSAASRFLRRLMVLALTVVVAVAAISAVGGTSLGLLDPADVPLMVTAFVMLSILWLLSGVLSLLGRVLWFGLGLAFGAACSYVSLLAMQAVNMPVDLLVSGAAGIGFGVAALVMGAIVVREFRLESADSSPQRVVDPPLAQLVVSVVPYFVYGVAYLLMVLSGHVGGWVGRLPADIEQVEAIAVSEMGLTLALMGYMLVSGVAEHTMQRFWRRVAVYQAQAQVASPQAFSRSIDSFYRAERSVFLVLLLVCSAVVAAAVVVTLLLSSGVFLGLVWSRDLTAVLVSGMLGYGFLAMGVFDTMFLITLSRPRFALEALAVGLITTLITSLAAGRMISYASGALGAVAGGLAFLIVARSRLQYLVRRADYFYYASF